MKRVCSILLGLALSGLVPMAAHATPTEPKSMPFSGMSDHMRAEYLAASQDMQNKDVPSAISHIDAVISDPAFAAGPAAMRYTLYLLRGELESYAQQSDKAYADFEAAGAAAPDMRDGNYWLGMIFLDHELKKDPEAAYALATLAETFPENLARLGKSGDFIVRDVRLKTYLMDDNGAATIKLGESLRDARYHPTDPFFADESPEFHLFEAYVANGEDDKASALIGTLTDYSILISLSIDKRYMRFVPQGPGKGDLATAIKDYVANKRVLAATYPEKLEGQVSLTSILLETNQSAEAQQILNDALAKIKAAPKDKPAYEDVDEQLSWVYDEKAQAIRQLTKGETTTPDNAALSTAIQANNVADEKDVDPVSQKINLADNYYQNDQNQKALDTLAHIDLTRASDYGKMAAHEALVCANAGLGNTAAVQTSLDYMSAHASDAPRLLRAALRCSGDLDRLATYLISNLDNPRTRNSTLLDLQGYLDVPSSTAFEQRQLDRERAVQQRSDVHDTLLRYGTFTSWPVYFRVQ